MTAITPLLEPEVQLVPPGRGPPTAAGTMDLLRPAESPEYRKLYVVTHAGLQDYLVLQRGVRRESPVDGERLDDVAETLVMHRFSGRLGILSGWRGFEVIEGEWYSGKVDIEIVRSSGTYRQLVVKVPRDGTEMDMRTYREERLSGLFWCMRNRPDDFAKYDLAVSEIRLAGNVASAQKLDWLGKVNQYVHGIRVMRGIFEVPGTLERVIEKL